MENEKSWKSCNSNFLENLIKWEKNLVIPELVDDGLVRQEVDVLSAIK